MRPVIAHTLVVLGLITSLGAANRPNHPESVKAAKAVHRVHRAHHHRSSAYQVGKASWYGKRFQGRKTASGERYDMFQFTAAHPELPLGTMLKVTNLRNGRWVIVRVNDRGPVPASRIIDLSYGAAQVLGLRDHGVARVRLDLVQPEQMAMAQTEMAGMQ